MGSTTSKSSSPVKGGEWKPIVHLVNNAESSSGAGIEEFSVELLKSSWRDIEGADESILNIAVYKAPLFEAQLTDIISHHQYIIFETFNYWWSAEKNMEGLTVQRSKDKDAVICRFQGAVRKCTDFSIMHEDKGQQTVAAMVDLLVNEAGLAYDLIARNCKDFALEVYNRFAKTDIIFPDCFDSNDELGCILSEAYCEQFNKQWKYTIFIARDPSN